jgi:hypothetical protein
MQILINIFKILKKKINKLVNKFYILIFLKIYTEYIDKKML